LHRSLLTLALTVAAVPAHASCTNYAMLKMSATATDKLLGEVDRLVCLHNEQTQIISEQEARIKELERKVDQLGTLALQHELSLQAIRTESR